MLSHPGTTLPEVPGKTRRERETRRMESANGNLETGVHAESRPSELEQAGDDQTYLVTDNGKSSWRIELAPFERLRERISRPIDMLDGITERQC